jgi:hypothetical protein
MHCWVVIHSICDRNSEHQLDIDLHPSGEVMESLGCYGRESMPCMLLLKVPELVYKCHCHLNCSVFCLVLFSLFFWVGFPLFHGC